MRGIESIGTGAGRQWVLPLPSGPVLCQPDIFWLWRPTPGRILIVSYGVGVDSTAILVQLVRLVRAGYREYRPEAIVFADTGGEKPETYDYLQYFSNWLVSQGFPRIVTVRATGKYAVSEQGGLEVPTGLEKKCLDNRTLPAICFGVKSCSDNFKGSPIRKWVRAWCKRQGRKIGDVDCIIGYEDGEPLRIVKAEAAKAPYRLVFPLPAWGWDRMRCVAEIFAEGLWVPIKSACFFCGSAKQAEIVDLAVNHPPLATRTIVMEQRGIGEDGKAKTVKGLGRSRQWTPLILAANPALAERIEAIQ